MAVLETASDAGLSSYGCTWIGLSLTGRSSPEPVSVSANILPLNELWFFVNYRSFVPLFHNFR